MSIMGTNIPRGTYVGRIWFVTWDLFYPKKKKKKIWCILSFHWIFQGERLGNFCILSFQKKKVWHERIFAFALRLGIFAISSIFFQGPFLVYILQLHLEKKMRCTRWTRFSCIYFFSRPVSRCIYFKVRHALYQMNPSPPKQQFLPHCASLPNLWPPLGLGSALKEVNSKLAP